MRVLFWVVLAFLLILAFRHVKAEEQYTVRCSSSYAEMIKFGAPAITVAEQRKHMADFAKAAADPSKKQMVELRKKEMRQFIVASVLGHPTLSRVRALKLVAETADMLAGYANDFEDAAGNEDCQQFSLYFKEQARLEFPLEGETGDVVNWDTVADLLKQKVVPEFMHE